MSRELLTGNAAVAWAARLADVDYVPAFPITPQTEIIETLSRWAEAGEIDARVVTLESEHSMLTAAGAAAATGVRVFTATSSQGLLYAMEMLYTVAGWRVPLVLVNVSRGLAAPITLEPDHNDVLAARDSGFLQIHCATCQEVLDQTLLAFRLAEDERVRLPALVNLDGFHLSFTREPVELPAIERVREFLPCFDSERAAFRAGRPMSQAVAVLSGSVYSYFRYETHLAAESWNYDPRQSVDIGRLAVETGVWPLKELADGRVIHTRVPRPRRPIEEYLAKQGRFSHLFHPTRNDELLAELQARVDAYWKEVE